MGVWAGNSYITNEQLSKTQYSDMLADLEDLLNSNRFNIVLDNLRTLSDLIDSYYVINDTAFKKDKIEEIQNNISSIYQYLEKVMVQELRDKINSL